MHQSEPTVSHPVQPFPFFFLIIIIIITTTLAPPPCLLPFHVLPQHRSEFTAEFPDINTGSYELVNVRKTFERLHTLVRAANSFFFAGDLSRAISTYHSASQLFKKLKNRKAIGVAQNNLGNSMLALYRTLKSTGVPRVCGLDVNTVVTKGETHYGKSIDAGEDDLKEINDSEGWSENYLVFMQQLSNRYFNRAMFLLAAYQDHHDPECMKEQGWTDLETCKNMDREVVDNGDREGFKGGKDVYFDLLLSRIKGILVLLRDGHKDEWDINELFVGAQRALQSALANPQDHVLFQDLEPAGQMQRLEGVLIEYHLLMASRADKNKGKPNGAVDVVEENGANAGKNNDGLMETTTTTTTTTGDTVNDTERTKEWWVTKAATIATRMMFEDDYVLGEVATLATKALTEYTQVCGRHDLGEDDPSDVRSVLFRYRHSFGETIALAYSSRDLISREVYHAANAGDFFMESF